MKKLLPWTLALGLLTTAALPGAAQTVLVGSGTPNASAALDVQSTTQGMLVPRMSEAQRTAIASPATGLMVYQTDGTAGFYFHNGTAWTSLNGGGGTTLPSQTGNAGKVLTTDGTNLSFTTYNKETLTMLRVPATGAISYTLPPFTDGVTTQIIVVYGVFTNAASHLVKLPDPATVPDGCRIILKKYSDTDVAGSSSAGVGFSWSGYPNTSLVNGTYQSTGVLALNSNLLMRTAMMLVKVSHQGPVNSNTINPTTTYSSWLPLLGWRE